MKKFTKICLATALVTFLIGCLLGAVGTMLGGLRQLEHVSVEHLTGIPFRFVRNGVNFSFGFWDDEDDWDEYWDWDSSEWKQVESSKHSENTEEVGAKAEDSGKDKAASQNPTGLNNKDAQTGSDITGSLSGMGTGVTADGIRELDIETGACQMYIGETAGDEISIAITGECEDHYQYRIKDGDTFMLVHKNMKPGHIGDLWDQNHPKGDTEITLYLPEGMSLDDINIDFGAGKLETGELKAREIEINVGAGDCTFEKIEASESVNISLGAGKITVNALSTKEADFDMAAGELRINGANVSHETKVDVSMGQATLNGTFTGELEAECAMGNLYITLEGEESDYNYEVDCGMGSISIGGNSYDGVAERDINNGSNNKIDVTCSMGNIDVGFTK